MSKHKKKENKFFKINLSDGFNMVPQNIMLDPIMRRKSTQLIWGVLVSYNRNPKNWGAHFNKKELINFLTAIKDKGGNRVFSVYAVEKFIEDCEKGGYLYRMKLCPYKLMDDNATPIQKATHKGFYWVYMYYSNSKDNPYFTGKCSAEELKEDLFNEFSNEPIIEVDKEGNIFESSIYKLANNIANERFKQSVFNNLNGSYLAVKTDDKHIAYIKSWANKRLNSGDDFFEVMYDMIAKTSYKGKDFDSDRNTEKGKEIAANSIDALKTVFKMTSTFKKGRSNINAINIDKKYAEKYFACCTTIICNLLELGFIDNSYLNRKQLIGLYKTICDNPSLIYLDYDKDSYNIFFDLFNKNQAKYVKQE